MKDCLMEDLREKMKNMKGRWGWKNQNERGKGKMVEDRYKILTLKIIKN